MRRKWLELAPWHSSQGDLSEGGDPDNGKSNGKSETQNLHAATNFGREKGSGAFCTRGPNLPG